MLVVLGLVGANRAMANDASDKTAAIKAKTAAKLAAINEYLAKHAGSATVLSSNSATLPTGGTWTPLTNMAPAQISLSLLLSDGTIMCQPPDNAGSPDWYRLTPDATGSYVNGTWTRLASMNFGRLFFQSQVLRDGRVFVFGAEDGSGTTAESYDSTTNTWTLLPPITTVDPGANMVDGAAKQLPNGNVLAYPVISTYGESLIFDIVSNTWSLGPTIVGNQDETSWVKLRDQSILALDINTTTNSERYIPSSNQWIADSSISTSMFSILGELGGAYLLPNGKAFFMGGTGHTAIYTPSGSTAPGTWVLGPDIPGGHGVQDGGSAMLVNGKILLTAGTTFDFSSPTYFYEYDYVANTFTQVNTPTGQTSDVSSFALDMLNLPDGSVLLSNYTQQLYVYKPAGKPLLAGRPKIRSVSRNLDGSYHVTGTLFNGISEGSNYGDEFQNATNYPIARLKNAAGNVYYARTYNWSNTGVQTGNKPVSTEMTLPAGLPNGTYSLSISANGNSSEDGEWFIQH